MPPKLLWRARCYGDALRGWISARPPGVVSFIAPPRRACVHTHQPRGAGKSRAERSLSPATPARRQSRASPSPWCQASVCVARSPLQSRRAVLRARDFPFRAAGERERERGKPFSGRGSSETLGQFISEGNSGEILVVIFFPSIFGWKILRCVGGAEGNVDQMAKDSECWAVERWMWMFGAGWGIVKWSALLWHLSDY